MIEIPNFKFALREDLKDNKEFLPSKAEALATGWDVKAAMPDRNSLNLKAFDKVLIPLGFRTFCPEGWWFELKPRSSTFGKKNLHCLYGTIDESYEGELLLAVQFIPPQEPYNYVTWDQFKGIKINFGDALGQIIPVKRKEMIVEEVSNEEYDFLCKRRNADRGTGGFGSTSK